MDENGSGGGGGGGGGGTCTSSISYSSHSEVVVLYCSSDFILDHVGQVSLSANSDTLSWKSLESPDDTDGSYCFGRRSGTVSAEIEFADIYAVESIDDGPVHELNSSDAAGCLLVDSCPIYSFAVHGFRKSKMQPSLWVLVTYTFRHKDMQTCQTWFNHISAVLDKEGARPKNLLVFVHPRSGKGSGCKTWETVAPIFARAKVNTKVIVTQRAGHAFDVMDGITNDELRLYDGVIAVGGDGFFNEILNGLLSSRYKAPYPPAPTDFLESLRNDGSSSHGNSKEMVAEIVHQNGHQSPLTSSSDSGLSDMETEFLLLIQRLRFGIIPAGSTDAIVICTTGARDPVTSALHIVLGKRVPLDIAQIVRWRTTSTSKVEPCVRYAASFAGYGFYGDVITESEKYRWMGPRRYDYAGTKVFLRHRSYEAEVAYLEVKSEENGSDRCHQGGLSQALWGSNKRQKVICRANCNVCNAKHAIDSRSTLHSYQGDANWLRCKGHFLSIGAAIIACRNERSPDGLVADAHLADGLIHLILIKDCPRAFYLWHLMQLAKKNGDPLKFDFVEYHKALAFTFKSSGKSSVWNLDGELFEAHQLSAQVFRGLVCLFAAGPQV